MREICKNVTVISGTDCQLQQGMQQDLMRGNVVAVAMIGRHWL